MWLEQKKSGQARRKLGMKPLRDHDCGNQDSTTCSPPAVQAATPGKSLQV